MNNEERSLLHYVAENDMKGARAVAKVILSSCKTAKDQEFVKKLLTKMESQDATGIEIPYNLKNIVYKKCSPFEFNPDRYFLTEREKDVIDRLQRMYKRGAKMEELGLHYTNAVLLYGESGTGKTTFAQYIAKTLDLPFFYVSITQLIDSYLGKTGQNMELVFNFASTLPCVLVLDEIDQIGTKRGEDNGVSGEIKRVLITIMQNLDRLPNNVILVAATNRINAIDEALLRRFPMKHEIFPMIEDVAACFVRSYLCKLNISSNCEDNPDGVYKFLACEVAPRQSTNIPSGTYVPAVIADCLNEKIADGIDKDPDNIVVSL